MRPAASPLEYLTAFAIVFATGFVSATGFIVYMERIRHKAVLDYQKKINSESDLSASRSARRSIDE